jgi:tripartite-type tricarboxylate transporter receptor subunit TctC
MNAEVVGIINAPEFQRWLIEEQGITPPTENTPEHFRAVHERDIARWREVVRRSGATVD